MSIHYEDDDPIPGDFPSEVEGGVIITHYPGKIYLDLETGEFTGTAEEEEV